MKPRRRKARPRHKVAESKTIRAARAADIGAYEKVADPSRQITARRAQRKGGRARDGGEFIGTSERAVLHAPSKPDGPHPNLVGRERSYNYDKVPTNKPRHYGRVIGSQTEPNPYKEFSEETAAFDRHIARIMRGGSFDTKWLRHK